jgi:putative aldouronate transport system permease protein
MENQVMPKKKKNKLKHWLPLYLMGIPGMAYLLINNYLPLYGLQIAFKKFNFQKGIWGSKWVGFDNFEYLFTSVQAFRITRNTLLYNLVFILLGIVLGVTVAILINEVVGDRIKKFYQTVILLPYLMSMVIIAYLVYAYLSPTNGLLNSVLNIFGIEDINWYGETKYWPFILVFVSQWKNIGFGMIFYLSSILGISKDYYEAAQIDGATKWQQIRKITLPLLAPTMITLLIISMGQIFRSDFGLFYQIPMHQGALMPVTDTIDTFVYRSLMQKPNMAMSSAAGFYQSIVGFILIVTVNAIVRKKSKENAMF